MSITAPLRRVLACVLYLAGTLAATEAIAQPWVSDDIGSPAVLGEASRTGDQFVVRGAGTDIWGTRDQCHFLHQPLAGDGSIVARVDAQDFTHEWAKAGVMMRASLDPQAPFVMSIMAPTWGSHLQWRATAGGQAASSSGRYAVACPYWVRLVRVADQVTAYSAPDVYGAPGEWQQIANPQPLAIGPIAVGLVVTSHNAKKICTATFSEVKVTSAEGNQDPVVARSAAAPIVVGSRAFLSVLGADDGGEAALTYTWSAVWCSSAATPPAVAFTRNGHHAARTTLARFTEPGAYLLRATIADVEGRTVTSDVAVTVLPTSSPVSPVCMEGMVEGRVDAVHAWAGADALAVHAITESRLYLDAPLAARRPVPITLRGAASLSVNAVAWTPTVVEGEASIALRANDALLLRLPRAGGLRIEQDCGVWLSERDVPAGTLLPQRFTEPGVYIVHAVDRRGTPLGSLTVTVTAIDFDGPVACQVGYRREKGVAITGPRAPVVFQSSDDVLMPVSLKEETAYGVRLYLRPTARGTPRLLARLGGHGAILGVQEVDEFTVRSSGLNHTVINAETGIGMNRITIKPWIPDLTLSQRMFAHRATFAGGLTRQTSSTGDWQQEVDSDGETVGVYRFAIETPPTEHSYCYRYDFDQHSRYGTPVSETKSVNGGQCKFTVTRLCLYEGDASGVLPIRADPENKKRHVHLHTASVPKSKATLDPATYDCKQAPSLDWNPTCTLNGTPGGVYNVEIDGTPFEGKVVVARVDAVSVKARAGAVNRFNGFDFRVDITVTGKGLCCLEIAQFIKASTTMNDLGGVAQTREQILQTYRRSDPVALFSDDFAVDTGWAWQSLNAADCTAATASHVDRQRLSLENRRVMLNERQFAFEGRLASVTRAFKIQLRLKGEEKVRFEKPWGYTWDNNAAAWEGRGTTRSDLGRGTFTAVDGIEGLP